MIRLTSAEQARELRGKIPALAVTRMEQFEGEDGAYDPDDHGHIVVLEPGDDISKLPEVSPTGLLPLLDPEVPGYEFLDAFDGPDGRTWEMGVAIDADRMIAVIFADNQGMDRRLRRFVAAVACPLSKRPGGDPEKVGEEPATLRPDVTTG